MGDHGGRAGEKSKANFPRTRATTLITVQKSEIAPYDQTAAPALVEIVLSETFTGDIEAQSTVRALQVRRDDRSASMISMQRVRGKLDGREGSFVLQGREMIELDRVKARWFVVPRSGTGELIGLRGQGGFEGKFGKGSEGTLEYWFEGEERWTCLVCLYPDLDEPPYDEHECSSFTICPCCGTEFGLDDATQSHQALRAEWIAKGMKWWSSTCQPPSDWDPRQQLSLGPEALE